MYLICFTISKKVDFYTIRMMSVLKMLQLRA